MEKTTIYALAYKGNLIELAEEKASEFQEEYVRSWTFEHGAYSGQAAINVGLKLAKQSVGPQFGTDAETVAAVRGAAILLEIVKAWDREADGTPMAITSENIGTLPPMVLRQFGRKIELGLFPSSEEIEAMKTGPLAQKSASTKKPD